MIVRNVNVHDLRSFDFFNDASDTIGWLKKQGRVVEAETLQRAKLRDLHMRHFVPSVMVMEFQPKLGHSIWIDYLHRRRSEKALVAELKRKIKKGEILGYRLYFNIEQVIGNV